MAEIVLYRVENTVGKGENAGNQHFLPLPQCFQKFALSLCSKKNLTVKENALTLGSKKNLTVKEKKELKEELKKYPHRPR